jgi:hypothetical protein
MKFQAIWLRHNSWRIPGGFLVFLVGLPGILQEYVGQCKDLSFGPGEYMHHFVADIHWNWARYLQRNGPGGVCKRFCSGSGGPDPDYATHVP